MTFGFREPYQIIGKSRSSTAAVAGTHTFLVDAEMVKDACRFKMDLEAGLQRTVHGKVKTSKSKLSPIDILGNFAMLI